MLVRSFHSAYRQRHLIVQAAAMLVFAAPSATALVPLDHPDDLDTPAVVAEVLEAAAPGEVLDGAVVAQANGVDITIPVSPSLPVTMETDGVFVELTLPARSAAVTTVDARNASVMHSRDDGVSLIPIAEEDGTLRVLSVVDDLNAPTEFEYGINATGLVSIELTESGGAVGRDAAGDSVITVEKPWAIDATGEPVSTSFVVRQGKLIQRVDTSGLSANQFPVVADPAITVTTYVYKYVTLARTSNWVNKAEQLGVCRVLNGAGGGTCTISAGYTVKASVDIAFGLTKAEIAAKITVNESKSVSGTVSWTSAKAPVGSSFKAWAVGTSVTYKIEKWKVVKAGGRTISSLVETSRTLKAFEPVKGFAVGQ